MAETDDPITSVTCSRRRKGYAVHVAGNDHNN